MFSLRVLRSSNSSLGGVPSRDSAAGRATTSDEDGEAPASGVEVTGVT